MTSARAPVVSPAHLYRPINEPERNFILIDEFKPDCEENMAAYSFWLSLSRKEGGAPTREDYDLLEIVERLPSCVLLSIDGPNTVTARLFGTALVELLGVDLTGVNVYDIFDVADRPDAENRILVVGELPAVLRTKSRMFSAAGVPLLSEWVFLPLEGPSGDIDRILISVAMIDLAIDHHETKMDGTLYSRKMVDVTFARL